MPEENTGFPFPEDEKGKKEAARRFLYTHNRPANSAIRDYFNREASLEDAVAVVDAYLDIHVPTLEPMTLLQVGEQQSIDQPVLTPTKRSRFRFFSKK